MKRKLAIQTAVFVVLATMAVLSLTSRAGAVQDDKPIRLLDDCDPATFNAIALCVGNGHTTLEEFFAELTATQDAHQWRIQPSQLLINIGRPTFIENRGGEVHTFTLVNEFGGGFIEALNAISGNPDPAPECVNQAGLTFIPPGGTLAGPIAGSRVLPVGRTKFQCCIHPWMRTVIEVHDPNAPQQ